MPRPQIAEGLVPFTTQANALFDYLDTATVDEAGRAALAEAGLATLIGNITPASISADVAGAALLALQLANAHSDALDAANPDITTDNPGRLGVSTPMGGTVTTLITAGLDPIFPILNRATVDQVFRDGTAGVAGTTFRNAANLVVPVDAGTIYKVDVTLFYKATATSKLKLRWEVPNQASWGGFWTPNCVQEAETTYFGAIDRRATGWGNTSIVNAAGGGAGVGMTALPSGIFFNNATAGQLQLMVAQKVNENTFDVEITRQSTIVATPIG